MLMTAKVKDQPINRWIGLAAVARQRASEQSAKAMNASDDATAEPHREQQAYLVRLAEVYEERAMSARSDGVDQARPVFAGAAQHGRVAG